MRQKLGLDLSMAHTQTQANAFSNDEMDLLFIEDLLTLMERGQIDFSGFFRAMSETRIDILKEYSLCNRIERSERGGFLRLD